MDAFKISFFPYCVNFRLDNSLSNISDTSLSKEPGIGAFIEEEKKETAICTQFVWSANEMKLTKHI